MTDIRPNAKAPRTVTLENDTRTSWWKDIVKTQIQQGGRRTVDDSHANPIPTKSRGNRIVCYGATKKNSCLQVTSRTTPESPQGHGPLSANRLRRSNAGYYKTGFRVPR